MEPLTFTITSGTIDYRLQSALFGTVFGSRSLMGPPVVASGYGDVFSDGGQQILDLYIDLSVTTSLAAAQDTQLAFDGTLLTPYTNVPEPAAVQVLLFPAAAVLIRRSRRPAVVQIYRHPLSTTAG